MSGHASLCTSPSVATAIANVFRKNGINVGRKFAKIMKILDKIDDIKYEGLFKRPKHLVSWLLSYS